MSSPSAIPFGGAVDEIDLRALNVVPNCDRPTVSGGVAFVYGELGYYHTDGTVRKAINNGTLVQAWCEVICIEPAGVANGASGLFRIGPGLVTGLTGGTANALAYVSGTAGAITTTAPTYGTTTYTKPIGRWKTSTVLNFFAPASVEPVYQG